MTRAKEKLFLIGTLKEAGKKIELWNDVSSHSEWLLQDYERASATSYIDWIGPALIRHQDCSVLQQGETGNTFVSQEITCHPSSWKVSLLYAEEIKKQELVKEMEEDHFLDLVEKSETVPVESLFKAEIKSRLTWEYSFADAAINRSKQSVSEMKRAPGNGG